MEIIATLVDMIDDEVNGAKEYACWANKLKATNPELAKTFYELSTVEMGHMTTLHRQVKKLIADSKVQNGEPPEGMMAMYELLHKKYIECAAQVTIMQEEYNKN